MQTEFEFTLPKGYLDADENLHRKGVMRLATAMDEIVPLQDPRVKANPAYATVIILARVINHLGALEDISPRVIEGFFACDLSYLQTFYRRINELEEPVNKASPATEQLSEQKPVNTFDEQEAPPEVEPMAHSLSAQPPAEEDSHEQLRQASPALL